MIKGFIFDLDGTLYQRSNMLYKKMSMMIRQWFVHQLEIKDCDEKVFFDKLKIFYPSALQAIEKFNLNIQSFHECVFNKLEPELYLSKDENLISTLSSLCGKKFLVTLSSQNHSKKVIEILGIRKFFSEIYNPGVNWHTSQKIDVYDMICKKYNFLPNEVCVVGDNYIVDLRDAHNKGYVCVLIDNTYGEIKNIQSIKSLLKIVKNENRK